MKVYCPYLIYSRFPFIVSAVSKLRKLKLSRQITAFTIKRYRTKDQICIGIICSTKKGYMITKLVKKEFSKINDSKRDICTLTFYHSIQTLKQSFFENTPNIYYVKAKIEKRKLFFYNILSLINRIEPLCMAIADCKVKMISSRLDSKLFVYLSFRDETFNEFFSQEKYLDFLPVEKEILSYYKSLLSLLHDQLNYLPQSHLFSKIRGERQKRDIQLLPSRIKYTLSLLKHVEEFKKFKKEFDF